MTQIDFYFNVQNKLDVIRKLVVRARQAGSAVLLYTQDPARMQRMDQYLWSAQALSFLPHVVCRHPLAKKSPVLIGDDATLLSHADVLINLDPDVPSCYARFDRLLEIVGEDEADRNASRLRFRYYKERGFSLVVHDLKVA